MKPDIRKQLELMEEAKYKEFTQSLVPDSKPMIGIRLPLLRAVAKDMVRSGNWKEQLDTQDIYFEEVMLRGMLIGYGSSRDKDIDEALKFIDEFIPFVDNWSICDSCCSSFTILSGNKERTWEYIQRYLYSDKEFEVRVALIIIMYHLQKLDYNGKKMTRLKAVHIIDLDYCDENREMTGMYTNKILGTLNREFTQGYYAQMAAAWLTAECFVTYPAKIWEFLKENKMDRFTFNKALQKICDSHIPSDDVKSKIKTLHKSSNTMV